MWFFLFTNFCLKKVENPKKLFIIYVFNFLTKNMKKLLVLVLIVPVVLFAGCGKKSQPQSPQDTQTPVASSGNTQTNNNTNTNKPKKIGKVTSIGSGFEKDSKYVYFDGNIISGANIQTFQITTSYKDLIFAKDDKKVYFGKKSFNGSLNADPKTFQIILFGYAKDKNKIYWPTKTWPQQISWADLKTFRVINDRFAKDKNSVYVANTKIEEADPATFAISRIDDRMTYAKDKNNVYFGYSDYCQKLTIADPATFQVFTWGYAKDKNNVYWAGTPIRWADIGSFQIIEWNYAKDAKNVYRLWNIITWADVSTFKIIRWEQTQDKNKKYISGEPQKK